MLRRIPKKALIGIGAGLAAIVVAVIVIAVATSNKKEAYRTIKVYDLIGTAMVNRGGTTDINAYVDMRLQSEDTVKTEADSYAQLKLDEDKYILLEPSTEIDLVATGNKKDSKTQIYLKQGAIVNAIENELSESSEYKIETPNSTMAVRGTTFRVELKTDENGETYTEVSVYEGIVTCNLIFPDGSIDEYTVEITDGKSVQIRGTDETSEYIFTDEDVVYEDLEIEVLEFIKFSGENGKELSIPLDELEALIDELKGNEPSTDNGGDSTEKPSKDDKEDPTEESTEGDEEEPTEESTEGDEEDETKESTEGDKDTPTKETDKGNNNSTTEPTTEEETTTEEPTTVEEGSYVVTFKYNGKVFATQVVKGGELATKPKLKPSSTGNWDYDFTKAIKATTTITWVE